MPPPDWHRMPPLSALRAFEATARLGSFSAAARVLNVTHAAVAQQVRALEQELGVALVVREGRGIALTAPGRRLAEAVGEGFAAIAGGLAALRQGELDRGLRVSCTASFAQHVLMPRLAQFWRAHPEIPVSIHPDDRAVDLAREGFDLGIRTGSGDWPGIEAELIARNQFLLVGAPAFRDADLSRVPWLLAPDYPDERKWIRGAGLDLDALTVIPMQNGALAVSGAVHGYGLVFASDAVVRAELAEGKLISIPFPGLPKITYWAVTPPGPRRPAVQQFIDWLKSQVRVEA